MYAQEFLRQKGILRNGATTWIVTFENGETIKIDELMEEYKNLQLDESTQ